MRKFLKRKGVDISWKAYFIDAMGAMAYGLFASLLVGTILNTIGSQLHINFLTEELWPFAQKATGPAIAVAIAYSLKAPALVVYASTVVGLAGNELGGPIGAFISTVVAVEFGKMVSKETKIDIVITPVVTVLMGVIMATFIGPPIGSMMTYLGDIIMYATTKKPLFMGIIVSVVVGMVLTLPISSAALCMMLSLGGLAGGAATAGCTAQMIGFAVISWKDNGIDGLISQGIGTSMLQVPNIIKNWKIWIPPTLASAITGPLATIVFKMENTPLGAGMGTCGFVGQIETWNAMSGMFSTKYIFMSIGLLHFILPALISYIIYKFMYNRKLIKDGDLKLVD